MDKVEATAQYLVQGVSRLPASAWCGLVSALVIIGVCVFLLWMMGPPEQQAKRR
jgi:hypothetical protein